MSTETIIFHLVHQLFNIPSVQCPTIALDNFDMVELMIAAEKEFNILFTAEECVAIDNVMELIAAVNRKI